MLYKEDGKLMITYPISTAGQVYDTASNSLRNKEIKVMDYINNWINWYTIKSSNPGKQ